MSQKRVLPSEEVAMASKLFEKFFQSMEFEDVISHYRDMCEILQIRPGPLNTFYPVIKVYINTGVFCNFLDDSSFK